jgi:hypothetical protein
MSYYREAFEAKKGYARMKKYLGALLILLPFYSALSDDVNVSQFSDCYEDLLYCEPACGVDRTFMYTRPIYRNVGAQLFIWHDMIFNHTRCTDFSFQVMPMFGETFNPSKQSRYFLFDNKEFLSVKGDNVITNSHERDVRAEWLGLSSNFIGSFSDKPFQRQTAIWFEAKHNLRAFSDCDLFERLWVGVAVPFHQVENKIDICESGTVVDPLFPQTIREALGNPTLQYQKFGPSQKRTGVGEIMVKFGSNFLDDGGFQIGTYSMLIIPAASSNNPEYVFSPYLGNNRHWGTGLGVMFQFPLNCDIDCKLVSFFFEGESLWFIRNFQKRTYDLKFKPWSRYMLLVNKDGRNNVPMTQVFTVDSRVRSYNLGDISTGFRFAKNGFQAEISYNLWARGRERAKPHRCLPSGWGIQGVGVFPGTTMPRTASKSTIQFQAENDVDPKTGDPKFIEIIPDDVRYLSAAARKTLNHRGQLALGYIGCSGNTEIFAGGGAYVEYAQKFVNKPEVGDFSRWGFFAKFGMTL